MSSCDPRVDEAFLMGTVLVAFILPAMHAKVGHVHNTSAGRCAMSGMRLAQRVQQFITCWTRWWQPLWSARLSLSCWMQPLWTRSCHLQSGRQRKDFQDSKLDPSQLSTDVSMFQLNMLLAWLLSAFLLLAPPEESKKRWRTPARAMLCCSHASALPQA